MKQYLSFNLQSWRRKALLFGAVALIALGGTGAYAVLRASGNANSVQSQSSQATTENASQATSDSDVLSAADAFLATLSEAQKASVLLEYSQENATAWSNFPDAIYGDRVGIKLGDLNDEQVSALKTLLKTAMGTGSNSGYAQVEQILAADDYLNSSGSGMASDYGSDNYFFAFLGTPSTSGTWMLQFGGHHMAVSNTYKDGTLVSATPSFRGTEPTSYTENGTTYQPMSNETTVSTALYESLSDEQKQAADLGSDPADVTVGPQKDGQFPSTSVGIKGSELSDEQKQKIMDVIRAWVDDTDDDFAARVLATYESQLNETYISFGGDGQFDSSDDYIRIDGPSVWIEMSAQEGIAFPDQVHLHSVWRDKTNDYASLFSF